MKYRFIMLCAVVLVALGLSCGGTELGEGNRPLGQVTIQAPDHDSWPAGIESVRVVYGIGNTCTTFGASQVNVCICKSAGTGCDGDADGDPVANTVTVKGLCPGDYYLGTAGLGDFTEPYSANGCAAGTALTGTNVASSPNPVTVPVGAAGSAIVTFSLPGDLNIDVGFQ